MKPSRIGVIFFFCAAMGGLLFLTSEPAIKAASSTSGTTQKGHMSKDLIAAANQNIDKLRKRDALIEVVDIKGKKLPGIGISIKQQSNSFRFGSAYNEWVVERNPDFQSQDPRAFHTYFKNNFNYATPSSTPLWTSMESAEGVDGISASYADEAIKWLHDNDLGILGHTVFWENPEQIPTWIKSITDKKQLKEKLSERISRIINRYKGNIKYWVGNNEMLDYSYLKDKLDDKNFKVRPWIYKEIKKAHPTAKLLVNEAGILAEPGRIKQYKTLIKELLNAGAPVDIIGIQSHFWTDHEFINFSDVKNRLDSLAELGLPIWITEFDYAHKDETIRANQLEGFYRMVYSHPSVIGITMWGFWEDAHWRADWGTPVHLVNKDWTLTKPGKRYNQLMQEWTTQVSGHADTDGRFQFRGFLGNYLATLTHPDGRTEQHTFELIKGNDHQQYKFTLK